MKAMIRLNPYRDNSESECSVFDEINKAGFSSDSGERTTFKEELLLLAGQPLKELVRTYPNLLVAPQDFTLIHDGIGESCLFDLTRKDCVKTGNLVGSFGMRKAKVAFTIKSRFDVGDKQYFLLYLLNEVLGAHVLNLPTLNDANPIADLSVYLLPMALKRAVSKGLFQAYREFERNDDQVNGTIDVMRHIAENMPFAGRVAYSSCERTSDNMLIQLVRHTIETVAKSKNHGVLGVDRAMKDAVMLVRMATPTYEVGRRQFVVSQNLRPVSHPYYSEYAYLQRVCLMIMRHERISFMENNRNEIYGVVFDMAWLWEEYLGKVLRQVFDDGEFRHPRNKEREGGICLYEDGGRVYPDFLWRKKLSCKANDQEFDIVLDAKYKRLMKQDGAPNSVPREDRYQMISYLHVTKARQGVFLFPVQDDGKMDHSGGGLSLGKLRGYELINGGHAELFKIPFRIPVYNEDSTFSDFKNMMQKAKCDFVERLKSIV